MSEHEDAQQLSTQWSRSMGLRLPVVNAPMGGVAGGRLAAAVTAAGGLGMIGMGSAGSATALETQLPYLDGIDGPFGIGVVDWVVRERPDLLETAIAARPRLLSVSFGTDTAWVARVREAGIVTATQVYDAEDARRAQDAGIDVLVARGEEGGGHGAAGMNMLPLLDAVLKVAEVPVLAAGGLAEPADLELVLAAGASGAWLGTRLAACSESLLSDAGRAALVAAHGTDTVVTDVFDIGLELPWPAKFPARVLRNDFTGRWVGHEAELAADAPARAALSAAAAVEDLRLAPIDAGLGVGAVTSVRPVGEVLRELCAGALHLRNEGHH